MGELVRSKRLLRRGTARRFRGHSRDSNVAGNDAEQLFRNLVADIRNPQFEDLNNARRIRAIQRMCQPADLFSCISLPGMRNREELPYRSKCRIYIRQRLECPSPQDDKCLLFTAIDNVDLKRLAAEVLAEFDDCEYATTGYANTRVHAPCAAGAFGAHIMNYMMRRSQLQRLLTKHLMCCRRVG